jgi:hypothetical protein
MVRAENQSESWKKLEAAIGKTRPKARTPRARGPRFASGKHEALRKMLVDAMVALTPGSWSRRSIWWRA